MSFVVTDMAVKLDLLPAVFFLTKRHSQLLIRTKVHSIPPVRIGQIHMTNRLAVLVLRALGFLQKRRGDEEIISKEVLAAGEVSILLIRETDGQFEVFLIYEWFCGTEQMEDVRLRTGCGLVRP